MRIMFVVLWENTVYMSLVFVTSENVQLYSLKAFQFTHVNYLC